MLLKSSILFSQVAINADGSAPDPSAMLDVKSTDRGLLIPRISTLDRDQIPSPATGLMIYNSTTNQFNFYNGSFWYQIESSFISSTIGTLSVAGGVSINDLSDVSPENSAMLDVSNPTRGILIPRTTPEMIISPALGLIIYNTATNLLNYFDGGQWITIDAVSTGITGPEGTQPIVGVAYHTDNSSPHHSAMLDIAAIDKGVLIPRFTNQQRNEISPATGLVIYNTSANRIEYYNGSAWQQLIITSDFPSVLTNSVSDITATQATSGGTITSDGCSAIIARGICWSTIKNPTTADSITSDGIGVGNFISHIKGLIGNTTYFMRAYATNSKGSTIYGNEVSFKTDLFKLICVYGKDSVTLKVDAYPKMGKIEWQESVDSTNWKTIPGELAETYQFIPTQTKYYRAVVKSSSEPQFSAVIIVQLDTKLNYFKSLIEDGNTTAWYDASDIATIVKDANNKVIRWNDKLGSGHDLLQTTNAKQPLWSETGILFDGIDDNMKSLFPLIQPESIYLLCTIKSWQFQDVLMDGASNNTAVFSCQGLNEIFVTSGGINSPKTVATLNEKTLIQVTLTGNSSLLQSNDLLPLTGNLGTVGMGGLILGSKGNNLNFAHIEVNAVIIRKVADTANDKLTIYNYFRPTLPIKTYETLSQAVWLREPLTASIGNVSYNKITSNPVNCGQDFTYVAKNIEDAYSLVGSEREVNVTLSNPELMKFVEDGINCQVFDMSGKYIYYGNTRAFYRIDKNTFGDKVKFLVSGMWQSGNYETSIRDIEGVNEMKDGSLLVQLDNVGDGCGIYKVPYFAGTSGTHTYLASDATIAILMNIRHTRLDRSWGLSTKGSRVFAVMYGKIGQAYLSEDYGTTFKCVFSMADSSINASIPSGKMIYVDTKPNGSGGFGAIGGHPMKNTLTNPQTFDLWGPTQNGNLHSHGGCIDTYADRLIIVTGDGAPAGAIFYSDDWGYNWTFVRGESVLPSSQYKVQFVTAIPMKDCILFGCDGLGDGFFKLYRNGDKLLSTIECCYQFTGSNTGLVTIAGGYCMTPKGNLLGLFNPDDPNDFTTIRGGIVATKNSHNFKKVYEDSFSQLTTATAEFGWNGIISINNNNKVLVKAAHGGLITLNLAE
jgi:hypothetical protein